jgi:hypothetical protein
MRIRYLYLVRFGGKMTEHEISRVEFWRQISERENKLDNNISNSIDGKCIFNDEMLKVFEIEECEKEAIRQGFFPDKYYTACQKMIMAKK